MHWIEEFRQRTGIDRNELAKKVKECKAYRHKKKVKGKRTKPETYNVECSATLIDYLEHGDITSPAIAAAIVTVCCGTAEQFDSIVHEDYRGQWKPGQKIQFKPRFEVEAEGRMAISIVSEGKVKRGKPPKKEKPKPEPKPKPAPKPKPEPYRQGSVVQINTAFEEAGRFASPADAAAAMDVSIRIVGERCSRKISENSDEMNRLGCTWRYADEWDAMTPEQRVEDMRKARRRERDR